MTNELPPGWKISIRDGGNRFLPGHPNYKPKTTKKLTKKEKLQKIKQIKERHQRRGIEINLKEFFPSLFEDD